MFLGFETLNLKFCDLKLWKLTVMAVPAPRFREARSPTFFFQRVVLLLLLLLWLWMMILLLWLLLSFGPSDSWYPVSRSTAYLIFQMILDVTPGFTNLFSPGFLCDLPYVPYFPNLFSPGFVSLPVSRSAVTSLARGSTSSRAASVICSSSSSSSSIHTYTYTYTYTYTWVSRSTVWRSISTNVLPSFPEP